MKLLANAKINLTVYITGKNSNGYHLLDSVFQSVSLFDEIDIEKSDLISVSFSDKMIDGDKSVAYKAATAFFDCTGISGGADIRIENNIPTSSGLGGGSSDAAAVLIGLTHLYGAGLTLEDLIKISLPLGADIPFCLVGGTARVKGIGEAVSPLGFIGNIPLIIIKDCKKASTADMYGKLDELPLADARTYAFINSMHLPDKRSIFGNISNTFDSIVDTAKEKAALKNSGALYAGLSGSGPSVFGIFEDEDLRDIAFDKLKEDHNCYKAEFSPFGVQII